MINNKSFFCAIFLLCLLTISAEAAQDSLEGYWQGAMARDGAVQVVSIDFFKEAGALKGRMELPDFVTYNFLAFDARFEAGKIQFESPLGKATLAVDMVAGEMIGTVGDALPQISLHLKRAVRPLEIPVNMEEVQFQNKEVTLSGTLVTPKTTGPHPAVVWIHGRSKSGRNGFRGFARLLAQRGVASLIYDKRGAGKSTGDHDKSGMFDFAGDAMAAVEFLATRKEIDRKQIGLHGTSAGGWVAAIVATRSKIPLAFIITKVGPADSVRDQQIHVSQQLMKRSGINFTPEEYAAAAAHMELMEDVAYTGKGWEELRASVVKAKQTRWASFVDLPESESYADLIWVRLNQYDPGPDLKKIKIPVLAMYGGSDYVVPPEENVKKLENYLTQAGNKDFKIVVLPEADHGLTVPDKLNRIGNEEPDRYYWRWSKLAPGMVETTLGWLLQHVNVAGNDSMQGK
jgi:alpha-beta hydrolase superfamily lysophospholipase